MVYSVTAHPTNRECFMSSSKVSPSAVATRGVCCVEGWVAGGHFFSMLQPFLFASFLHIDDVKFCCVGLDLLRLDTSLSQKHHLVVHASS